MQREKMIDALVVDSMIRILDQHRIVWLSEILESGFGGFKHMTDAELLSEMSIRGLGGDTSACLPESADDENRADQGDNSDHGDYNEWMGLIQARLERARHDACAFEDN